MSGSLQIRYPPEMNILKKIKERKLGFDILATFSALLCITVVCEIFYSSSVNKELVLKFEKDHYSKKVSSMAANWLNSYFQQIELIVSVLSQNDISNDGEKNGFDDFENLFKEGLQKTPYATNFCAALKDGSCLQIFHHSKVERLATYRNDPTKTLPDYVAYGIQRIKKQPDGNLVETWEYLNDDFTPISEETVGNITFSHRKEFGIFKLNKLSVPHGLTFTFLK